MSTNNPLYQHLVSHTADREPQCGWSADDVPELSAADIALVCAAKPQSVADNIDPVLFVLDVATGKNPAVRLPVLIERAAREALFYDVEIECELREQDAAQDRAQAAHNRLARYRANA